MPLIICDINVTLTWSVNDFVIADTVDVRLPASAITDTKLYVAVVTLSIQDKVKLLQLLKSGFWKNS